MAKIKALLICSLLICTLAASKAFCAEHMLMPSPTTAHVGNFNAALKPVLTINSGDVVTIETACNLEPAEVDRSGVVPPSPVSVAALGEQVGQRAQGFVNPDVESSASLC
jgi:hypothetical protein